MRRHVFLNPGFTPPAQIIFKALRPHQWVKSAFVFLPLIFGSKLFEPQAFLKTLGMSVVFALASSAVYLLNDIYDLEEDKKHPDKCTRPLAAGLMTGRQAVLLIMALSAVSLSCAYFLNSRAAGILLVYFFLNLVYSRYLKRIVIIDVFCIGVFYYLRIAAGGIVSEVSLSSWILICSVLLALFIGFNKRKYDLDFGPQNNGGGDTYTRYYIDRMISIIASSLIMSYALYVMDKETVAKFHTQALIYTVPLAYYGIFRYIYLVDMRLLGGDPVRILWKDHVLKLTVLLWLIVCAAVIYF
ncbi:MAG TPA: decaprenyl-phosphate phosphoribosyltransferase [Candidatus Omnitrophota bacterium]|nr:decaprenyl-phosphate phosphoribosyltransferase [Candidatus Omnitrophota bacterium]HQO58811.1 decaprenyl-phosphate phosphoribosyltransferase [Candidatus Omnitrophota bacterium]